MAKERTLVTWLIRAVREAVFHGDWNAACNLARLHEPFERNDPVVAAVLQGQAEEAQAALSTPPYAI